MRQLLVFGLAFAPVAAFADEWGGGSGAHQFDQHYGMNGQEERAIDVGSRDVNGNRVVVNGRIMNSSGTDLSGGVQFETGGFGEGGFASSSAIGNQLNVVTTGSFNTVIIDSTQINHGNQTATVQGE